MKLSAAALNCLSNFSFLKGASHAEDLVAQAHKLGYAAIAITDECSVSGMVRAHVAAREHGMRLICGAGFAVHDCPALEALLLLAPDREAWGDLCELITRARRRSAKGGYRLELADLSGVPGCLAIALPHTLHAAIDAAIARIGALFPARAWLGAALAYGPDDRGKRDRLVALGERHALPVTLCERILFAVREDKPLHDVLTAVHLKKPVAELGTALLPHAEHHLKPIGALARRYPTAWITESLAIAARCRFSLDELRYEYPREIVPSHLTPAEHLRQLTAEGAARRYPAGVPAGVQALIDKELTLIAELQYEAYFLTIHDVVAFARAQRILCQGRGSAANSAVCYCLGITEVDPARMQVLFERFISKERNEPPDIDVDFEHERREEVMQYLYAKYGRERTALTAAVSTYRPKGAIRDVGKALGLTLSQVDQLSKAIAWWDGRAIAPERLREAGFDPEHPRMQLLLALTASLIGFPRHLSQHSGGFVIARDKLTRLVPVENAAMENRTVIQWDKDDLDELGLLKVDVLALGMLTAIRKTLDLVGRWRGQPMAMQDIPAEDPATYAMIQAADTIGVFQIESRAQMSMLPRLKPKCFYDLVIEVAIVRPGPIQGGMVHPYLKRRTGEEPVSYPSEAVRGVLERTLGVSIFQEQVMQLAVVAAGFTPGEADRLRRAMAAWKRKGGLEPFREKIMNGMAVRGYSSEFAESIYRQMHGFGEYGFPESHAASFALLVYASCWLKRHHAAAFTCGLLNSQPLGFYAPSQLVQDARRHGIVVLPVDVTASDIDCTLERVAGSAEAALRLGLRMVAGLDGDCASRIAAARDAEPFADAADLKRRAGLTDADLARLAAADALAGLSGHRREALWDALGVSTDAKLFQAPPDPHAADLVAPSEAEDIVVDYRTVGLTLRRHPMALIRPELARFRMRGSVELRNARHGQLLRAAGLVTCRQRPSTAKGTTFVTLEDEDGYVNVVVWSHLALRQRRELLFARLMGVAGRVERQGNVIHLIAGRLFDYTALLDGLDFASHDFH